ncbi:MAG: hypothetical protein A2006_04505 [Ignavibacteria bacterium GWC2_35_8]|nr:MAG: hypothetical protein A2006_04505 [Ignavibacteria bacterium GWC2_35_8]
MVNLQKLLEYYVECIEIESFEEFSFPSFKENQQFIIPSMNNEWSTSEENLNIILTQDIRRSLALNRQSSSLYYGWPTYVEPAIAKNGNPYQWLKPLFLLKVEFEEDNQSFQLSLVKEWPKVNDGILKRFAKTFEERIQIIDSIGLSDAEIIPDNGLMEYWTRFKKLYSDLPELSLEMFSLSNVNEEGFYSIPLIIVASTAKYNRQLLKELRYLKEANNLAKAKGTSLESLINGNLSSRSKDFQLSQITSLNRSQRKTTLDSFNNSISVITGPPGTGKSQVVLNILVNAFENNQSVLFTSKNNKAVDVVCERILRSVKFPINLRLGSKTENRDYTTEFLDLLDTVLSGGDKDSVLTDYNRTKRIYDAVKINYYKLLTNLDEIVATRNRINKLDEEIEKYESILENNIVSRAREIKFRKSPFIDLAKKELSLLKSNNWPISYKIFRVFSKSYPYKKIHQYLFECNNLISQMLTFPELATADSIIYESYFQKFLKIFDYVQIYNELTSLRKNENLNNISQLTDQLEKLEKDFIEASKKYIEALGRYRIINLSNEDRRSLTNYYSVVKSLSGEYPGDKAYSQLKRQQENLFEKVSRILPVWSVTNLSVGGHFPFIPNAFDILIIDESSQSDIASSLPLLFRSKNAVIIGDPQQLKHISSISKAQDNRLMQKYSLIHEDNLRFSYSIQSLYHCARGIVSDDCVTLLNEHYRSHYSIIEFSNREWYDGHLDIRTNYDNLFYPPDGKNNLEWINTKGETERLNGRSALNKKEANEVLVLLSKFLTSYQNEQPSIGIVTPFSAQAEYLKQEIIKKYDEHFIKSHFLITDTAHKFQGDERDIVIFSPVIAQNISNDSTLIGFLRSTSNLFNVAITRARSILWIVGDREKCVRAGIPYLKSFVEYIEQKKYEKIDLPYDGFASPWEKKFYEVLVSEGFQPKIQYPVGPYFVDLALFNNNKKIAIEVDGERWHTDLSGERLERDITRDKNLRRMNFIVIRFWTHDLKYDLSKCVNKIKSITEKK